MRFIFLFILFCTSSNNFFAQKRIIKKPSKEYIQQLNAAKSHKLKLIRTDKQLNVYINSGRLVKIMHRGYGWRLGKLIHSHPYLVPKGRDVLRNIARDFVKITGQNAFVITSLTRTLHDQNKLRIVNGNAAENDSSHNFGSAFDVSYIRFNNKVKIDHKLEKSLESILKTYVKAGKIYYVKESKFKCFHVVIRNYK